MPRQRILWFAISLLILSSLACNAFAGDSPVEPALTLPPPPITETDITPSPETDDLGLAPTATLPGAVTDVPLVDAEGNPLLEALVDVNIRTGPGVHYDRDGFLFAGETAKAIGRDPINGWWKIECPGRATGTACWVSGGAQYTKVTNSEGVPIAAAPPTPTPEPSPTPAAAPDAATSIAANGLLAYADDDGLWLMTLDMSQPLPASGETLQLSTAANVERPFISPDGRKIAYFTSTANSNMLYVIDLDRGSDEPLANSSDLPVTVENVAANTPVFIQQVAWLADSQALVFNSSVLNQGFGAQEDLWRATLDGTVTNLFTGGSGGGIFALSANNQVAFSQSEAIVRANLAGTAVATPVTFDFINTASEYIYYPQAQWTTNASDAYVAIPNAEPWNEEAAAVLWRIPASGPAERLETLTGNILFNPVYWSPDGSRLAYVQQEINATNPPLVLTLAEGDGRNPTPYTSDSQLTLYGWSPDGSHFLYAASSDYAVGHVGMPPTRYPMQGATADMQWLDSTTFVTAIGGSGAWNLRSNNINGDLDLLTIVNSDAADFDVWTP